MKITEYHLEDLIEERYLERGYGYYRDGLVKLNKITDTTVEASAVGTRVYNVKLFLKKGILDGECTCPAFRDFGPCKHMAATGYALIAHNRGGYAASEDFEDRFDSYAQVEKGLMAESKEDLIARIMQYANDDWELMRDLEMEFDNDMR